MKLNLKKEKNLKQLLCEMESLKILKFCKNPAKMINEIRFVCATP